VLEPPADARGWPAVVDGLSGGGHFAGK